MSERWQGIAVILIFGLVVGWLASLIVGGGNLVQYIVWGLLGAVVGGFLMPLTGVKLDLGHPILNLVVTATLGAVVVVLIARLIA